MIPVGMASDILWTFLFLERQNRPYAMYGMGKFAKELLTLLKRHDRALPVVIFDDSPTVSLLDGIPVYPTTQVPLHNVSEIVLATDTFQKEMRLKLGELHLTHHSVIDLSQLPAHKVLTNIQNSTNNDHTNINFTLNRHNLAQFHNIHAGRRAFVVGNGPSLARMDVAKLRNEITFSCNRVFLGFAAWGFHFKYWLAQDETNIRQSAGEYMKALPCDMTKFIPIRFMEWFDLSRFQNCYPINIAFDPNPFPQMSTDPHVIYDGWCAAYSLVQLAIIMGCRPIYLVGVDYRYNIKPTEVVDGRWTAAGSPNHFASNYCNADAGQLWNLPSFERTNRAFALMAEWNASNGNVILNATPGSALKVFPEVDFNTLFD